MPDAGHSGLDSFTYTVSDGNGGTDVGTVVALTEAPAAAGGGDSSGCVPGAHDAAGLLALPALLVCLMQRRR